MTTLSEVKQANKQWFTPGNKRFFGDVRYSIIHSRAGKPYLLRTTYAWSDMFGAKRKLSYRINPVDPDTLKIGHLLDDTFTDRDQAKRFIKSLN